MEFPIWSSIPNDIIVNILSRLPAKTIGICRCVSKQWRDLCSTPQFIKAHLNRIRETREDSIILLTNPTFFTCLSFNNAHQVFDEITASSKKLSFASKPYYWTEIIGSCDGLVLVGNEEHKKFLINPTIHQIIEVPGSPFAPGPFTSYTMYGLGYDSVNDDYKIVALSYYYDTNAEQIPDYTDMFVHIYSVKNDTWNKCESSTYDVGLSVDHITSGVFVEGCIHWLARRTVDYSMVIAAFDVVEEKFFEMPTHRWIDHKNILFHYLDVLAGCLCICSNHIDVWMMKEYGVHESWTKFVILDPEGAVFRPMCLLGQEKLVLKKYRGFRLTVFGKMVTYNLEKKTFKDVVVHGIANNDFTFWGTYMETLVSPHRINELRRDCEVSIPEDDMANALYVLFGW